MPQKNLNVRKQEPNVNPLESVWWKPLFSVQKEAAQACQEACSSILPANEFWQVQNELLNETQNQMHRIFGEIFNTRQMAMPWLMGSNTEPYMDITENGKSFTVRAELPGVSEKNLEISVTDGGLVIRGEKNEEQTEEDERTLHRECHYGFFSRTIALPEEADLDKAEASFENNVLNITVPKKADGAGRPLKIKGVRTTKTDKKAV